MLVVVLLVVVLLVLVVVLLVVVVVPRHGVRSRLHVSTPSAVGVSHGHEDWHEDARSDHVVDGTSHCQRHQPASQGASVVVVVEVLLVVDV